MVEIIYSFLALKALAFKSNSLTDTGNQTHFYQQKDNQCVSFFKFCYNFYLYLIPIETIMVNSRFFLFYQYICLFEVCWKFLYNTFIWKMFRHANLLCVSPNSELFIHYKNRIFHLLSANSICQEMKKRFYDGDLQ